jgi:hypothetical protein
VKQCHRSALPVSGAVRQLGHAIALNAYTAAVQCTRLDAHTDQLRLPADVPPVTATEEKDIRTQCIAALRRHLLNSSNSGDSDTPAFVAALNKLQGNSATEREREQQRRLLEQQLQEQQQAATDTDVASEAAQQQQQQQQQQPGDEL